MIHIIRPTQLQTTKNTSNYQILFERDTTFRKTRMSSLHNFVPVNQTLIFFAWITMIHLCLIQTFSGFFSCVFYSAHVVLLGDSAQVYWLFRGSHLRQQGTPAAFAVKKKRRWAQQYKKDRSGKRHALWKIPLIWAYACGRWIWYCLSLEKKHTNNCLISLTVNRYTVS